jgi:hypothetical protein
MKIRCLILPGILMQDKMKFSG